MTWVAGMPLIVGGAGSAAATAWMLNAGSEADSWPSLTLITMLANVPALVGVPLKAPVEVLKVAQDGRFWTLKVSAIPCGSDAVGVKE